MATAVDADARVFKRALRLQKAKRAYPYILKISSFMHVLSIKDGIVNTVIVRPPQ